MASNSHLVSLWLNEEIRGRVSGYLENTDLGALRLTSSRLCDATTPTLFTRTRLTFTPNSFSHPSRMEALFRVGHLIEHLTFSMPHSASTFLPPLLNPVDGREVSFLYTPHTSLESETRRPTYGTSELGSILTDQYPPIFHAATNVPAFIRFMKSVPNLRHLSISTPGQDAAQRYRRSAVDYALISLRIALERTTQPKLYKLTMAVHPSALLYLKPTPSIGSSPRSTKFCSQIRKLKISILSWDFQSPTQSGNDHLQLLDTYVRAFSRTVEKLSFAWDGRRGPCPLTLPGDSLFAPQGSTKLFAEITSPHSPLPAIPTRSSMLLPRLRYLRLRNIAMIGSQMSDLVYAHRKTVRNFEFDDVELTDGMHWHDAVSPLTRNMDGGGSSGHRWKSQQSFNDSGYESRSESQNASPQDVNADLESLWPCLGESDVLDSSNISSLEIINEARTPVVTTARLQKRRVKRRRHKKPEHDERYDQTGPVSTHVPERPLFGAVSNASCSTLASDKHLFGALPDTFISSAQSGSTQQRVNHSNHSHYRASSDPLPLKHMLSRTSFVSISQNRASDATARMLFGSISASEPYRQSPPSPSPISPASRTNPTITSSTLVSKPPTLRCITSPTLPTLNAAVYEPNISRAVAPPIPLLEDDSSISKPLPTLLPATFCPSSPQDLQVSSGVVRDHALDARLQELTDDPEKRKYCLRGAREAVIAKLGCQFSSNGASARSMARSSNSGSGLSSIPERSIGEGVKGFIERNVFGTRNFQVMDKIAVHGSAVSREHLMSREALMASVEAGMASSVRSSKVTNSTQTVPLMILR